MYLSLSFSFVQLSLSGAPFLSLLSTHKQISLSLYPSLSFLSFFKGSAGAHVFRVVWERGSGWVRPIQAFRTHERNVRAWLKLLQSLDDDTKIRIFRQKYSHRRRLSIFCSCQRKEEGRRKEDVVKHLTIIWDSFRAGRERPKRRRHRRVLQPANFWRSSWISWIFHRPVCPPQNVHSPAATP